MSVTVTSEQWDEMQKTIDTLANLQTMLVNGTTVPDRIHVEALRGSLPATVTALQSFVRAVEGDNE